ncbi:TetR/AcrR family transcriptional regulator [Polluticoccus soli]
MKQKDKQAYDQTKTNILKAVGNIIQTEGYTGLFIRNIARKAHTSGKMIYYHFGTLDNLIETYIKTKDHWRVFSEEKNTEKWTIMAQDPSILLKTILNGHFEEFTKNKEMQKIILWEISQYTEILRKEADLREEWGNKIFALIDPKFKNSDFDIRSVCAILVAGIYYLILHAENNGSTFCERDINKPEDRLLLIKTINQLIDMCIEKVSNHSCVNSCQ